MDFKKAFSDFMLERSAKGLSEKSLTNYRDFIVPFITFVDGVSPSREITHELILEYIQTLYKRKLAKDTVATYTRHLKVFLRWLSEHEKVSYNVDKIPLPRTHKKEVHIFSDDEIRAIFEAVSAEKEWITLRNRACIALMLDSGLRRAEICGIRNADFSENGRILKVCGKGSKERTVSAGRSSLKLIAKYKELCPFKDSESLFVTRTGKQMTINALKLLIQKISKKLPFEFSCHRLRHNFATNYCIDMYEKKGSMDAYSLQILLGHSSLNVTMRYIHHAQSIVAARACISHLDMILD